MSDAIRELAEKATPGPWVALGSDVVSVNANIDPDYSGIRWDATKTDWDLADARLIALAPDLARVAADLAEALNAAANVMTYSGRARRGRQVSDALAAYEQLVKRAEESL